MTEPSCEHGTPACLACTLAHKTDPKPLLYTIEAEHIERLKAVANRLLEENSNAMDHAADIIMSVVRYAEALQALRGPGEPYVHLNPKEKP